MTNELGICASATVLCMVAQVDTTNLPNEATWAQLGALSVCVGLLIWLITKRIPAVEDKHAETIKHLVDTHHAAVNEVCLNNEKCITKIQEGQSEICDAIQRGNDTHSQILTETLLTKRLLEKHEAKTA
jgi:hypothetical protein